MNRNKPFLLTLLLASLSLAACSGLPNGGGTCTTNCGGGNTTGTVSVTITSSTPPAAPALVSFKALIIGLALKNTATGATANLTLANAPNVEFMRLQSDSTFVGSFPSVTAGTYDSVTVAIGNPILTFINNTGADINNALAPCPANALCTALPAVANSPTITFPSPISVGSSGGLGFSININMTNAISVASNNLSVSFDTTTPTISAVSLPRANSNLTGIQLDRIEDFVGVVSLSGSSVTVTSPVRGTLTATANSSTIFDSNPDVAVTPLCVFPGSLATCAQTGQVASVDAVLNSDGTLTVQEYEPLAATALDILEGTVVSVDSPTQFTLVVTDKTSAATSIDGIAAVGDRIAVTLASAPPLQTFFVDTKGLPVENTAPGSLSLFAGGTTTDPIKPGQTLAVHVTNFVGGSGAILSTATVDKVTLRFSRFTSVGVSPFTTTGLNVSGIFPYFSGSMFVQTFLSTPGVQSGTNYDGVADPTGLSASQPVAIRALFIENSANNAVTPFFAAKVRKP